MWARIDDGMPDHPKLARLGTLRPLAGWLHVCGICYCARYLTDGFIPVAQVVALARFDRVGYETGACRACSAWARTPTLRSWPRPLSPSACGIGRAVGYLIHDYLDYNPSRAVTLAKRYSNAERVRKFRSQRQEIRRVMRSVMRYQMRPVPVPVPQKEEPPYIPPARWITRPAPIRPENRIGVRWTGIRPPATATRPATSPAPAVSPNGHGPLAGAVLGSWRDCTRGHPFRWAPAMERCDPTRRVSTT